MQFMLMYLPPVGLYFPLDIGVHSRKPLYEGHQEQGCTCAVLNDKCYFSPNFASAPEVYERFKETNDPEIIWTELEHVYRTTF